MKLLLLSCIAAIALAPTACQSWPAEKKAAFKAAAISEAETLALSAFESYTDKGSVNAGQVAVNGLGGFAALLRALEMPNNVAPTKEQLKTAALEGSGNKPALAKELQPLVNRISQAINSGAPPAETVETAALGLDKAQANIALTRAP